MTDLVTYIAGHLREECRLGDASDDYCAKLARFFIAAVLDDLMEPTEAMGKAAVAAFDGMHYTQVWQAMLDAKRLELALPSPGAPGDVFRPHDGPDPLDEVKGHSAGFVGRGEVIEKWYEQGENKVSGGGSGGSHGIPYHGPEVK